MRVGEEERERAVNGKRGKLALMTMGKGRREICRAYAPAEAIPLRPLRARGREQRITASRTPRAWGSSSSPGAELNGLGLFEDCATDER